MPYAMPAITAERLCPEAVFLPPDFTRYKAVSRAVRTPSDFEGKEFITFASGAPITGPDGGLYVRPVPARGQ